MYSSSRDFRAVNAKIYLRRHCAYAYNGTSGLGSQTQEEGHPDHEEGRQILFVQGFQPLEQGKVKVSAED